MEYNNLRNKIGKFYNGGKIPKYEDPGQPLKRLDEEEQLLANQPLSIIKPPEFQGQAKVSVDTSKMQLNPDGSISGGIVKQTDGAGNVTNIHEIGKDDRLKDPIQKSPGRLDIGAIGMGVASAVLPGAMAAMDSLTGDKNFGAQSQAIDSAVHGVSGALMSSGNPYAMAAGAALEGINFVTKAGGQTVQGYDVNIENSGYGNLGHQESSSSRSFLFGLGDITGKKMQAKLARRNEQARMALQAAEISEDVKFEQEARMNSVDNVLRNNQIALAGGIDTSLLGS